jgi:hypothetical protein
VSVLSPSEYHTALIEAANAVEAETGAPVGVDGSSAGYKKFADKVKAMAQVRVQVPQCGTFSHLKVMILSA